MKKLYIILAIAVAAGFLGYAQYSFGEFNPTGGSTYRLASSIGTTDTTIRLSSFKEPVSDIPYTMTYLDTNIVYGTVDPDTSRSEFISFTGITQNSNGTASLTGVTRGLARSPGASDCTTASSTLKQSHAGQAAFILSDAPCFFSQYAVKQNNETITGQWTFSVFPITPASPAASETTAGISELATGAEAAASTLSGATGFRLTLPTAISTSTYNANTAANRIPVTGSDGTIDEEFLPLNTTAGSSTVLTKDANGNWYFFKPSVFIPLTTYVGSSTAVNATTTLYTYLIAANTLSSTSPLRVTAEYLYIPGSSFCKGGLQLGTGGATTTIGFGRSIANQADDFTLEVDIYTTGPATQFAKSRSITSSNPTAGTFLLNSMQNVMGTTDTAYSVAVPLYLAFTAANGGDNPCRLRNIIIEQLTQYPV